MECMLFARLWKKRALGLACIAVAVPLITTWLAVVRIPWIRSLELVAYDMHCRHADTIPPDSRIVVVGMYDDTPEHLGADAFPLSRATHATLVDILHRAGARVIVFDMWFTRPAPADDDHAFAQAARNAGSVYCALKSDFQEKDGVEQIGYTLPEPALRQYIRAGSIAVQRSFGSRVRWYLPYPGDANSDTRYLALPIAAAAAYQGHAGATPVVRDRFVLGSINLPLGPAGETLIRYAGGPETYKPVRYEDVYSGAWTTNHTKDSGVNKCSRFGPSRFAEMLRTDSVVVTPVLRTCSRTRSW
jgi:CHASE2 domain-containing sensor protein